MIFALLFRFTRYWTGSSTPQDPCSDVPRSAKRHLRSAA